MDPIEHLPRHARGISLLEVLVAFAIMALALGLLLRIFGTGLRSSAAAERYSAATLWAESLMAGAGSTWPLDPG
ncbi:MAG: type IV pilus modification PilV family protein, partial [Gammaproteobacteria bacterium]